MRAISLTQDLIDANRGLREGKGSDAGEDEDYGDEGLRAGSVVARTGLAPYYA